MLLNNNNPLVDYLIIGQGIAGTMMAYFLEKKGLTFNIVDAVDYQIPKSTPTLLRQQFTHPFQAASNVSTGIINPITGRRFVKSWMIETLFPFAETTYRAIEKKLNKTFYINTKLYRTVPDQKAMTDFLLRLNDPNYQPYFANHTNFQPDPKQFNINKKGIVIEQAARVNVPYLIQKYREYLIKTGVFIQANFNHQNMRISNNAIKVAFKNEQPKQYKKLIFCEGYRAKDNPFFSFLPFTNSNGQALMIESPQLQLKYLLKSGLFLIPKGNQQYQVGTTWNWDIDKPTITANAQQEMRLKLNTLLKVPFTIIDHQAAVRPTIKDRRPVLGKHPKYANIFLLNGLGSKGVSLSPYFAKQLVLYLLNESPLLKEVSINRFL